MGQFNNDYFSFDGIYSRKFGYKIISLDDGFESSFGIDRSIDKEKGVNGDDIFYGVENNNINLQVSICKTNDVGVPLAYTREELNFINRWFFAKKEPLPFECDGLIYYVIFIKSTKWSNGANMGYLTFDMELMNGIAYEPVKVIEKKIEYCDYIYLYNDSTATDIIYPNYEFKFISGIEGSSNYIIITNETTGQVIEINGIKVGERIIVDNNIKDMRSENSIYKNIYKQSNGEWLYLVSGRNVLRIDCHECDFKIKYQNKMGLI